MPIHTSVAAPIAITWAFAATGCRAPEGPADNLWEQVHSDLALAPQAVLRDTRTAFGHRDAWVPLGLVGIAAAAMKNSESNGVEFFLTHDIYNDTWSHCLDTYGSGELMFGAASLWYVGSWLADDHQSHARSRAYWHVLTLTSLSTIFLKALDLNGRRPDGDDYGFPSGHSSMSMATATALQRMYGWRAGAPAYLLAGAVALQRLDRQRHDLADVIFGLMLGHVIADRVLRTGGTTRGLPSVHPVATIAGEQVYGVGLRWSF